MHELTLIQNILTIILETAKANNLHSVNKVTLQVGRLRQVVPEFLQFAFATVTQSTIVAGAQLMIVHLPVIFLCHNCQQQFTTDEHIYICPKCQNITLEIISGKEIIITSIEGESYSR